MRRGHGTPWALAALLAGIAIGYLIVIVATAGGGS